MREDLTIAAVSLNVRIFRTRDTLDQMARHIRDASGKGASLICFPELSITGYALGETLREIAIPVNGDEVAFLQELASRHRMVILAGLAEKGADEALYATHLAIMPDGTRGVYRKLHVAPPEKDHIKPGDEIPVFYWEGFCFGIQLCYDAHFPELTTRMALKGVHAVFMPHASPRGSSQEKLRSWMRHLPARAFDNGIFVIACNQAGDNGKGLQFPGLSVVIAPSGELVSSVIGGGEDSMMIYTLSQEDMKAVRNHRMRYFLPNRRKDIFGG